MLKHLRAQYNVEYRARKWKRMRHGIHVSYAHVMVRKRDIRADAQSGAVLIELAKRPRAATKIKKRRAWLALGERAPNKILPQVIYDYAAEISDSSRHRQPRAVSEKFRVHKVRE